MTSHHDYVVTASELGYRGRVIALRRDTVRMPDGAEVSREVVEHYGAVAILPVDETGRIGLIEQYRHPVGHREWEIPAGLLDGGPQESPIEAAQRELVEEIGFQAARWGLLVDLTTSPGFTDESVRVFVAQELSEVERPQAEAEELEIALTWTPAPQALRMVLDGEITNAIASSAITAWTALQGSGGELRLVDAPWRDRPTALAARYAH